jgi:hypothetical protein
MQPEPDTDPTPPDALRPAWWTSAVREPAWRWTLRTAAAGLRPAHLRLHHRIASRMESRPVTAGVSAPAQVRHALASLSDRRRRPGEVWGTTVVRNEADIIADSVGALLRQGVDRVVVADNMSTDETVEIVRALDGGDRVTVVRDAEPGHFHGDKMTHLAHLAARAGADWVIPFDADELWFPRQGAPIAAFLRGAAAPIVTAESYEYLPARPAAGATIPERYRFRWPQAERQGKIAFRTNILANVRIGNHSVNRPGAHVPGLEIAHFRYRSFDHIAEKVRHGAKAIEEARLGPGLIRRWRELAKLDDDGLRAFLRDLEDTPDLVHDPVGPKLARCSVDV